MPFFFKLSTLAKRWFIHPQKHAYFYILSRLSIFVNDKYYKVTVSFLVTGQKFIIKYEITIENKNCTTTKNAFSIAINRFMLYANEVVSNIWCGKIKTRL